MLLILLKQKKSNDYAKVKIQNEKIQKKKY